MRPDEKELLGNVVKMSGTAWFLHGLVETPLHEYGHYWAATLLGYPVVLDGERALWASARAVPPLAHGIIFAAGGLTAGLVLLALFFLTRPPYRTGLLPLIAAEFAYAPLDATGAGNALGLLAFLGVWALVFSAAFARFLGWHRARVPVRLAAARYFRCARMPPTTRDAIA